MAEHVASTGFRFRESSMSKFRVLEVFPTYKLLSSPALHTVTVATDQMGKCRYTGCLRNQITKFRYLFNVILNCSISFVIPFCLDE
jgi:hypothetical protein